MILIVAVVIGLIFLSRFMVYNVRYMKAKERAFKCKPCRYDKEVIEVNGSYRHKVNLNTIIPIYRDRRTGLEFRGDRIVGRYSKKKI